MKKIVTLSIILSSIFFSSIFTASANEGYLEQLLEINTGIEVFQMENIPSLDPQYFSNSWVQATYDEFIKTDTILRTEFIRQYRAGEITNYQMQDLITNYGRFIYYTNQTFWYIAREERWLRGPEIEKAIYNGYSNMRVYYNNVKNIVK